MARSKLCSKCGDEKDEAHLTSGYCRKCASERRKEATTKKRLAAGLQPWGSGKRKLTCCGCGKLKQNIEQGYCFNCKNECERKRYIEKYNSPQAVQERRRIVNEKYQNDFAFKLKKLARDAVQKALKEKVLIKQPCIKCGETNVDAHHNDYMKPLDVIWLCRKHHMEHHRSFT